jgi:hypothetical protein
MNNKKLIQLLYDSFDQEDVHGLTAFRIVETKLSTITDASDPSNIYVGECFVGNLAHTGGAVWRIQKIVKSGTLTTAGFANGTAAFDKVWDNRATSYTYS